jgi:acyl carrier protein
VKRMSEVRDSSPQGAGGQQRCSEETQEPRTPAAEDGDRAEFGDDEILCALWKLVVETAPTSEDLSDRAAWSAADFAADLEFHSLAAVELAFAIEHVFGIEIDPDRRRELRTVDALGSHLLERLHAAAVTLTKDGVEGRLKYYVDSDGIFE